MAPNPTKKKIIIDFMYVIIIIYAVKLFCVRLYTEKNLLLNSTILV